MTKKTKINCIYKIEQTIIICTIYLIEKTKNWKQNTKLLATVTVYTHDIWREGIFQENILIRNMHGTEDSRRTEEIEQNRTWLRNKWTSYNS